MKHKEIIQNHSHKITLKVTKTLFRFPLKQLNGAETAFKILSGAYPIDLKQYNEQYSSYFLKEGAYCFAFRRAFI